MTTFTWKTSHGTEFEVEPEYDVDSWSGREMRAVERLNGGSMGTGWFAMRGAIFAVSIARAVPGYTIESADAELTAGRIKAVWQQILDRERAEREAAAAAEIPADPAQEDIVMSPTKPGEPDDAQPRE